MNKQLKENEICHVTVKLDHNTEGEFGDLCESIIVLILLEIIMIVISSKILN